MTESRVRQWGEAPTQAQQAALAKAVTEEVHRIGKMSEVTDMISEIWLVKRTPVFGTAVAHREVTLTRHGIKDYYTMKWFNVFPWTTTRIIPFKQFSEADAYQLRIGLNDLASARHLLLATV